MLESRRLLSTLAWTNRGEFDGFDSVFGANAGVARGVVDAVLALYGQIIVDLNNDHANRLDISIAMSSTGTGFGGAGGPSAWSASGVPQAGEIILSRGDDITGDGRGDGAGYYLDPVPTDSAEFSVVGNAFVAGAPAGSPLAYLSDFYNLVAHEVGHVIGFGVGNNSGRFKSLATFTGLHDTVGHFYTFNGPSIRHLLTSANGGADGGSAIHSARADVTPIFFGGTRFDGCYDLMNWFYVDGARRMINDSMLLMLKDAYGYTINLPQKFGTYYAMLNRSTGELVVRGGAGTSTDTIVIDRYSDRLRVSVDLGNDIPATGALPGNEPLPAFVSDWQVGEVSSVRIEAGDGNDSITIRDIGYSAGTNGFFRVPMSINGGAGTDSLVVDDPLDRNGGGGGVRWEIDQTRVQDFWGGNPANGHADYSAVENLSINGGSLSTWYTVNGLSAGVSLQVFGNDGDDLLVLSESVLGISDWIHGDVYFNGGYGYDEVVVYDFDQGTAPNLYTFNSFIADVFDKSGDPNEFGMLAAAFHEQFLLLCGSAPNRIEINGLAWSPLAIQSGDSDDVLVLGSGLLDQIVPRVDFYASSGFNEVIVNDSGEADPQTYELHSDGIHRGGVPVLWHTGVATQHLYAGVESDTINVESTNYTTNRIDAGPGDDWVEVDNDGVWDSTVTLNAGPGFDRLWVDDRFRSDDMAYQIRSNLIAGGAASVANEGDIDVIGFLAGAGSNEIDIDFLGSPVPSMLVSCGDGRDLVRVGSLIHGWAGLMTIIGGGSDDQLVIDDSSVAASLNYSVSVMRVEDGVGNSIEHAEFEYVQLLCAQGNDSVSINVPGAAYDLMIATGTGVDSINVIEASGAFPVRLQSGPENDDLAVSASNTGMSYVVIETPDEYGNVRAGRLARIELSAGRAGGMLITGRLAGPFDTGEATLDFGNQFVVLDNGREQNVAYLQEALQAGYAGGTWWGGGFCSTVALMSILGDGVGNVSGNDLFGSAGGVWRGIAVSRYAQILAYTLDGDTDLDADVDFADLLRLAQHYGTAASARWIDGDFTYDTAVSFHDLLGLAQNYGSSLVASDCDTKPLRRGYLASLLAGRVS